MFLSIYNNRSGDEFIRRLAPNESLDLREHVCKWAETETDGQAIPTFSEPGSYIPNGCADWQAELRRTKSGDTGSCWTSEPFYLDWQETE